MIGRSDKILHNGYNLACALRKVDVKSEREKLDATALCSANRIYEGGFQTGTVSAEGKFASDTVNLDELTDIISAAFDSGADNIVSIGYGLFAIGGDVRMFDGCVANWDLPIPIGGLILTNANWTSNNGMRRGKWLLSAVVAAGTTTGTSVDNAAASSNGGLFHAHWQNDTATGISIKVQHSTNNSVWVDLAEVLSGTRATGSYTFGVNPTATDTVAFNGVTYTFIAGASSGTDVQIKGSLSLTLVELASVLNASANGSISVATYTSTATKINISYDAPGTGGNAYALGTNTGNIVRSATTLLGGLNATAAEHSAGAVTVTGSVSRYSRGVARADGGDTILTSAAFARG